MEEFSYSGLSESQKSKLIAGSAMILAFFFFSMALGWFFGFGYFILSQAIGMVIISRRFYILSQEEKAEEDLKEFLEKMERHKR